MLKNLTTLCAIIAFATTPTLAEDISDDKKACFDSTFDLAQTAMNKKLSEERLDEVEAKITKIEDMCETEDYDAAKNAVKEIESDISGS